MAKSLYHPFYWDDYFKDTAELDLCQHGAYMCLLGLYWQNEGPLPDDMPRLQRILRQNTRTDGKTLQYVLQKFFVLKDGSWHHKRVDIDITKIQHYRTAQQVKGTKSAEARASKTTTDIENDSTTVDTTVVTTVPTGGSAENQPLTQPEGVEAKAKAKRVTKVTHKDICPISRFDEFWFSYPEQSRHNKKRCLEVWRIKRLEEHAGDILAALEVWKRSDGWQRGFIPYPQKFLNAEYWLTAPRGTAKGGMGGMAGAGASMILNNRDGVK